MFAKDAASDPPVGSRSRGAKLWCRPSARWVQDLGGRARTQLQPKLTEGKTIAQQFCFTTCFITRVFQRPQSLPYVFDAIPVNWNENRAQ